MSSSGAIFDLELPLYARLFNQIHPDVIINFDTYAIPFDFASQSAVMARLLADPPDILGMWPTALNFDKLSFPALFADINQ